MNEEAEPQMMIDHTGYYDGVILTGFILLFYNLIIIYLVFLK